MSLSEAQRRAVDAIADSMAIMCKGRGLQRRRGPEGEGR